MTWKIKEGCFGCARCTQCSGIEMDGMTAKIVDSSSSCIKNMASICPAGIIQNE